MYSYIESKTPQSKRERTSREEGFLSATIPKEEWTPRIGGFLDAANPEGKAGPPEGGTTRRRDP